jgi:ribosomal protein S18 acetylase RimI-like enzyme
MPIALRPLTASEVAAYLERSLAEYVAERIASGEHPDQARRTADEQRSVLYPDGAPAAGHHLYRVVDDRGTELGVVWIGPQLGAPPDRYWVFDVEILPEHRGRGLGRQAMLLAEEAARSLGATELGLNVFGQNAVARSLYESLGYQTTAVQMRKPL